MRRQRQRRAAFYDCQICGYVHAWAFAGDCRDDQARFTCEQLDSAFGPAGYDLHSMDERLIADVLGHPGELATLH